MVFQNDILAGSSGASGASSANLIAQSIRFNDDDNPYMERTYGTGGNTDKWTVSFWLKRGNLGIEIGIFGSGNSNSNTTDIQFNTSDQLIFWDYQGSYRTRLITTQVFRDTSAWYHVVAVYDSGNATSGNRAIIYINGSRVTAFGTETYPSQNQDSIAGSNVKIGFGRYISNSNRSFDGYLAEMHYVNGSALAPTDFGETTSDGIWKPIEYTGSHGTGGFYIKGEDSSDLGNDSSGNGNDLTTSGLASHDQVADSPTNNFCVINPLNTNSSVTISNGNLQSTASAFSGVGTSILLPTTGKWYCEFRYNNASAGEYPVVGVYNTIKNLTTTAISPGKGSGDLDVGFGADGRRNEDDTNTSSWGNSVGDNKIGAIAIDTENKKIWFGHNNSGSFVWQVSGDPSSGTNQANTKDFADDLIFGNSHYVGSILVWNFGQDGTFGGTETAQGNADGNGVGNFYYAPPTGYLALCTKNIGA